MTAVFGCYRADCLAMVAVLACLAVVFLAATAVWAWANRPFHADDDGDPGALDPWPDPAGMPRLSD